MVQTHAATSEQPTGRATADAVRRTRNVGERGEFSPAARSLCDAAGIDIEQSYAEFMLDIKVGGPVTKTLISSMYSGKAHHHNLQAGRDKPPRADGSRYKRQSSVGNIRAKTGCSTRELQVLTLFARGLRIHAVADQLGIADSTVKRHLSHIAWQLGSKNITHAVAIATRKGLI